MNEDTVVYEFSGEIFENAGQFLDALGHEYKVGDKEEVVTKLEDYGFDLADIGV